ncbi:MAG: hypothetical protein WCI31_16340 [Prolixibacteraceae bacterium]|jgi:uncharacterized radical SAM superfamily Fe-S cluster-containing enzyme
MRYQLLERLTEKVSILEKKMEENSDFYNGGEFEELYQEALELFYRVQDFEIAGFPYETATEKMENVHRLKSNKFDSIAKRMKRIEDNAELKEEDEPGNSDDD